MKTITESILKSIKSEVNKYEEKIIPTTTDTYQIRKNLINSPSVMLLKKLCDMIEKQYSFIGSSVYKYAGRHMYTQNIGDFDVLNKMEGSVDYTEDTFKEFLTSYLQIQIDYYTRNILEFSHEFSTDPISNFYRICEFEAKQRYLEFVKELNDGFNTATN